MMKWLATGFVLCLICLPVNAEEEVATAYKQGEYARVVELSDTENATADALALAARAVLSECVEAGTEPDTSVLKKAESLAARAVSLDPLHIEGRLQLAISLSLQARYMTLNQARKSGYGGLSRQLAEEIIDADPDNAWAYGFLSVWHVEVRRMGGSFGGAIMGANLEAGEADFRSAMKADPDNILLAWQYARALTSLNAKKYQAEISQILAGFSVIEAKDQLELTVKKRATSLLEILGDGQYDAAEQMALNTL